MPLILILAGAMLVTVAFRGTEHEFARQATQDFGGSQFVAWAAAVLVLGAIGYYRPLRGASDLMLALVIVAMTLANGGLFAQLAAVIDNPPAPSAPVPLADYQGSLRSSSGGGSSGGGGLFGSMFGGGGGGGNQTAQDVGTAVTVAAMVA